MLEKAVAVAEHWVMRILIVCGAGASSTFLALWLRTAAKARQLDAEVTAASDAEIDALAPDADVVLVGPHLVGRFDELADRAAEFGAGAVLLPESAVTARDGDALLELALAADVERPIH